MFFAINKCYIYMQLGDIRVYKTFIYIAPLQDRVIVVLEKNNASTMK